MLVTISDGEGFELFSYVLDFSEIDRSEWPDYGRAVMERAREEYEKRKRQVQ